jgi:YVTN family beta-propeller protein
VQQNPLRERVRAQLMLTLYRSDRQAEALQVYQEFRHALSEELGLDPSPGLQQLEVALLNRDASLDAPPASGSPVVPPEGQRPQSRRRWLAVGTATLIAIAGAAIVVAVAASTGSGSAPVTAIAAGSVGVISPARDAITAVVPVGSSPSDVAAGAGSVWVANYNANSVSRIDPVTHAVEQTIPVDSTPSAIAVGDGAVWVADNFSGKVSKIDPAANRVVQTIPVGNGPSGIAVGVCAVWVTNSNDGTLCPYTLSPTPAGGWHAPNLRRALSLIAASGTRGTPITIWNQPGFLTDFTSSARYIVSVLDRLGYPTRVKPFSVNDTTYLPRLADSRTSPQAYFFNWTPNYPAASEFLGPQFWSCKSFVPGSTSNSNLSEFCDPRFDATVRSALAAEAGKSPTAAQLWAKADRQFTDQAPTVNLATPSQTDLVSRRVGDYQYNAQLGVAD